MFATRPLAAAAAITRKVVPLADRVLVRKIEQVQKVRPSAAAAAAPPRRSDSTCSRVT